MEWILFVHLFYSPGDEPIREAVSIASAEFYSKDACEAAATEILQGKDYRWPGSYAKCYTKSGPPEEVTLNTVSKQEVVRGFPKGGLLELKGFAQIVTVDVNVGGHIVTLRKVGDSAGVASGQTAIATIRGTGSATLEILK